MAAEEKPIPRWLKIAGILTPILIAGSAGLSWIFYTAFTSQANNDLIRVIAVQGQEMAKLVAAHEVLLQEHARDHDRYDEILFRRGFTSEQDEHEDLLGDATPGRFGIFRRQLEGNQGG